MSNFFDFHRSLFEVEKYVDAESLRGTGHGAEEAAGTGQRPTQPHAAQAGCQPGVATSAPFSSALREIEVFGDTGVLPSARDEPHAGRGARGSDAQLSPQQLRLRNRRASTEGPAPWMRNPEPRSPPGKRRPALGRSPVAAGGSCGGGGATTAASPDGVAPRRRRRGGAAFAAAPSRGVGAGLDGAPDQHSAARASPPHVPWAHRRSQLSHSAHRAPRSGKRGPMPLAVAAGTGAESRPVPKPFERGYQPLYGRDNPRSRQALEEAVDMGNPLRPPIAVSREDVRRKVCKLMGTLWTGESVMELDAAIQRRVHAYADLDARRERLRALLQTEPGR